jgi:hypothetical protein
MQQIDSSSCGFFTITYAIDIAFGIDPKNPSVFITNATLVLKIYIKNIIIILGIFKNASYIYQFHLFIQPLQF